MSSPAATSQAQAPFMENLYAVILAGGVGKRFMPYSTEEMPKQFLHITDPDRTMIQMTYDRITQLVPKQNVFISTNARYTDIVQAQLPDVPAANIVGEPLKKNTAAPIALLNHFIWSRDAGAVALFLPSDHYIADTDAALDAYKRAAVIAARRGVLITFGVVPTFPSPDYGYVQRSGKFESTDAFAVRQFVEKPDEATAQRYLDTGEYFWNGGMFCWNVKALFKAVAQHMPVLQARLRTMERLADGGLKPAWLQNFFEGIQKPDAISVDYAIMEPASNAGSVITVPFKAGWSDVGGWIALKKLVEREGITLHAEAQEHMERWFAENA